MQEKWGAGGVMYVCDIFLLESLGQGKGSVEREVNALQVLSFFFGDGWVDQLGVLEPFDRFVDKLRNPVVHPDPAILQYHSFFLLLLS